MLNRMPKQKEPKTVFGARLITARRQRGFTQIQLAQAIKSTQRAISYYEAEGGNPNLGVVVKIAQVLGTTADDLLGLTTATGDRSLAETTDERRLWRRFRQLLALPEKDRRAVLRMLDSLTKTQVANT